LPEILAAKDVEKGNAQKSIVTISRDVDCGKNVLQQVADLIVTEDLLLIHPPLVRNEAEVRQWDRRIEPLAIDLSS
jgi:hypothetical protein